MWGGSGEWGVEAEAEAEAVAAAGGRAGYL